MIEVSGIYSPKNDKVHDGVKVSEYSRKKPILNGINWEHFRRYMVERYRANYFNGTEDPIISRYHFSNVFRDEDKTTQFYIREIVRSDYLCYNDQIFNTILFRLWNNADTFKAFGGPWYSRDLYTQSEAVLKAAEHKFMLKHNRLPNFQWWNPKAYPQNGLRLRYNKEPWRVLELAEYIKKRETVERIRGAETQREVYKILCELPYFGPTLAYQVFVDLTYMEIFPFSDREFAIVDADTFRGLKYLFLVSDMRPEAALFYVRVNFDKVLAEVQERFLEPWEVQTWKPRDIFLDRGCIPQKMSAGMICHNLKGFGKYMEARDTGNFRKLFRHV